jgi:hypothetical protein
VTCNRIEEKNGKIRRNALSLERYVRDVNLKPIDLLYARVLADRVLPTLSDDEISEEADRIEEEAFNRLGPGVNPEYYDPGDFVDAARDEAIEYMLNAINKLRLIANCSKHADRDSCRELREKRPDFS